MRILVEILHPAHVHVFRHAIGAWRDRGDEVLVLSREKECANALLSAYGIPYTSISRLPARKAGLAAEILVRTARMIRACRRFRPDVLTGIMGVTIAPVGRLIRRPAVVFYDTENAGITNRFVYPLAHSVCTPTCYQGRVRGRHVTYPGYHELAYLHPDRFTPDPEIVRRHGVDPDRPFFLVRRVAWQASHDLGERGLDARSVEDLVARLEVHGRVLISSEQPLPAPLADRAFRCPPDVIHHFLAFARMVIGESATMASEAAVLGTPAFFISDTGRGYTDEEEARYGLVHTFRRHERDRILATLEAMLAKGDRLKADAEARRRNLLADKIDTTAWMIDYLDAVVAETRIGHPAPDPARAPNPASVG